MEHGDCPDDYPDDCEWSSAESLYPRPTEAEEEEDAELELAQYD
jgi:hypothetical protein